VPTTTTTTLPPPSGGVAAGISLGVVYENKFSTLTTSQQQAVIDLMKADGVRWLRIDAPADLRYKAMMKLAGQNGIRVDAILQDWQTSATPAAMAQLATSVVGQLQPTGVETYEVLNEPNGCQDSLSAADYTSILKSVYPAVKGRTRTPLSSSVDCARIRTTTSRTPIWRTCTPPGRKGTSML
jgi:hypothetical protein